MIKITKLLALVLAIYFSQVSPAVSAEKKLTPYQRQVNLMKRVNEAEKSKQLSVSEAKAFRKDLSKIAVKKQKVRDTIERTGKTSPDDMSNVEEHLTKTSGKINKRIHDNVVDAK